jgi:thiamine biosynthesis lipoprotein
MDTLVTITVVSDSEDKADKAMESAFSVIDRFGKLINFFSDGSELSSINGNAGVGAVRVSPETVDVVEKAVYISQKSEGAFDATIGPEIKLWDFVKKVKPADDEIRKNLGLVNYRDIVIDRRKSTVFLRRRGMLMDLGGIAKGYAADLAVENLKENGIRAGIVANAGDIRVFGLKPDGALWNVGIANPRKKDESDELIARIKLADKAISTSGDYERYFIVDGRRFHHILDPKTGYPAPDCRSVTIITNEGVFTDGFSTAVFVLGPEKGMKLVSEMGMDAMIIDNNGKVYTTPGIKGILTVEENR